jgi:hypothetical protein
MTFIDQMPETFLECALDGTALTSRFRHVSHSIGQAKPPGGDPKLVPGRLKISPIEPQKLSISSRLYVTVVQKVLFQLMNFCIKFKDAS